MDSKNRIIKKYSASWISDFVSIKGKLDIALAGLTHAIEHVGSTAVPNLDSKPIIDVDIVYYFFVIIFIIIIKLFNTIIIYIIIIINNHIALAFPNLIVATKAKTISTTPKNIPIMPTIISMRRT
jgi:hypothetical protein